MIPTAESIPRTNGIRQQPDFLCPGVGIGIAREGCGICGAGSTRWAGMGAGLEGIFRDISSALLSGLRLVGILAAGLFSSPIFLAISSVLLTRLRPEGDEDASCAGIFRLISPA